MSKEDLNKEDLRLVMICFVVGVFIAGGLLCFFLGGDLVDILNRGGNQVAPAISGDSDTPDKIEAWVMAKSFVKDKLPSPGTANFGSLLGDFQDPREVVTDLGNGKFRVKAWVDSQNVFGATVRTEFSCELIYKGNDQWGCSNLSLN